MLERVAGVIFIFTGLGYIVFPPLYEVGAAKVLVPTLGLIDLFVAYDILKGKRRLRNYYLWGAVGGLAVAIPFWGKSAEFYGSLMVPMMVVESLFIAAALILLISQVKQKYADSFQR